MSKISSKKWKELCEGRWNQEFVKRKRYWTYWPIKRNHNMDKGL